MPQISSQITSNALGESKFSKLRKYFPGKNIKTYWFKLIVNFWNLEFEFELFRKNFSYMGDDCASTFYCNNQVKNLYFFQVLPCTTATTKRLANHTAEVKIQTSTVQVMTFFLESNMHLQCGICNIHLQCGAYFWCSQLTVSALCSA